MDMKKILSNKWVWIGGAGLGALVLLSRGGSSSASSSAPSLTQWATVQNQGAQIALQNYQASANYAQAMAATNVQALSAFGGILQTLANANVQNNAIMQESGTAQLNSLLTTNAAQAIDAGKNMAGEFTSLTQAQAAQNIAHTQAQAATAIANTQASASTTNSIISGITSLAGNALKAFGL